MKQTLNSKTSWLLLLSALLITGCLPINPAIRAAVVIYNDTDTLVNYQLELSASWSPLTKIEPGQLDYVMEYNQVDKSEGIPWQLTKIKLITADCKITLHRKDILKHMTKDPEGRSTWDLHVNKPLLKKFGCR